LRSVEPEILFDPSRLRTEGDWIRAGELVFDAPIALEQPFSAEMVRDPEFVRRTGAPVSTDGTLPTLRYVVREKGKVELGSFACGMCHTRVQPDGSIIKGAQGNFPGDRTVALSLRRLMASDRDAGIKTARQAARSLVERPWETPDRLHEKWFNGGIEDHLATYEAVPPGVFIRHRSSPYAPTQLPDLIGIKQRKYFDKSGLQLHRGIVDLMRYAALNQGADDLGSYKGFIPAANDFRTPVDLATQERYSDEQLYALALYLYQLEPPPNPNHRDGFTDRGAKIFAAQGCGGCHTPPLYTNNKLLPAPGFTVPKTHLGHYDILRVPIGTDPTLTMETRRGTGYYKVPSLKGVWYRGPFEHNGSVATLEDWFDAARLREDYTPAGWRGYGVKTRAVKGHTFGLNLSPDDKKALIAFLKTL
jgi:hypothetical protein